MQIRICSLDRRWLVGILVILFWLAPVISVADQPIPTAPQPCAECHTEEAATWQGSPHAAILPDSDGLSSATCENCHGEYIEGHPDTGTMTLMADSSVCRQCHTDTAREWQDSLHAQEGVQCIGCHLSHSQTLRLTDQTLCTACHQNPHLTDATYQSGDAGCLDCHSITSGHQAITQAGSVYCLPQPDHNIQPATSLNCLTCHPQQTIHQATSPLQGMQVAARPPAIEAADNSQPDQLRQLQEAEQKIGALQQLTVFSLGAGLGLGALLGIIFMLAFGCVTQGSASHD